MRWPFYGHAQFGDANGPDVGPEAANRAIRFPFKRGDCMAIFSCDSSWLRSRWLKRLGALVSDPDFRRSKSSRQRRARRVPTLELLEERQLPSTSVQSWLSNVYRDLLNRPIDAAGLASWESALNQGMSRLQVAQEIELSTEYRTDQVQGLYSHYLHRSADASGLASNVAFLQSGGTVEQTAASITGSAEFFQNNGATNFGFLAALYQDALGRPIDATGAATWGALLTQGVSRNQVAFDVMSSTEYDQHLVQGLYNTLLLRTADGGSLKHLVKALLNGTRDESVIAGIVASTEFFNRMDLSPYNVKLALSVYYISAGGSVSLSGSFAYPGTLYTHQVAVNWGDGSANSTVNLAADVLTFGNIRHVYDNPIGQPIANYLITVTVTDNYGGRGSASTSVQVITAPPTVVLGGPFSAAAGTGIPFTASVTDPSPIDTAAGFTYAWNFGDGSTSTAASPTHAYAVAGTYTVSLTATDKDGQSGTATTSATATPVNASAASVLQLSGFPTLATAGAGGTFTVTVLTASGAIATGYTGTVHFTSSDGQAVLPGNYTFTSGDQGVHTFSATLKTAGSWSVTATDTVTSSITGTQSGITVSPAAATHLSLSAPASSTAGSAFTVTVTAQDAYGNTASAYTGTLHFTSSDGQAVLPANYAFTAADKGVHTFSATLTMAGSQTVTATDTVTGSINGSAAVLVSAAATHLSLSAPASSTAGSAFTLTVTAQDAYGNTASGYTGTVHFTSSDGQAVLPGNYTFTSGDLGVHTFSATLKTAGSWSVTATDTATSSITGTQSGITVSPAAATHLSLSAPASSTAGSAFTVTVTAQDAFGNTASGYTGTLHFTSSDGQAVLPANYAFTAADKGVHTFSATLKTAGSQSVTATDTATSSITGAQSGITVSPAVATHLSLSAPASSTAGTAFTLTVAAQDAYGNTASGYTGTVHFTSSDGKAVLPADYTFTAADKGVHAFTATLETSGSQSLTATDKATASITGSQSGITVNPAAASSLQIAAPDPVTAGSAFNFTVTSRDAFGNTATGYTGTVHFTSSDGQAVLPANYTFSSTDQGVHAFSATLKTSGSQSLTATDTVIASITGTQIDPTVFPAAAGSLQVAAPAAATAGSAFTFTVTAHDAFGNKATGYTGTLHFTSSDGQAVLPANYTFSSTDQGVHTFSATLKTAGSRSVTATDTATSSITGAQPAITVSPAAATHLSLSAPASSTPGTAVTVTVTAQDAYGNTASGYTGTLHITSSDGLAVLPANYTFSSTDKGVHTFSATLTTAGSQTVTATDTVSGSISGSAAISVNAVTGTTYYVSTTGSDSNGGTQTSPFRTINYAVSLLHPGDTLYIRGGTYAEALQDSIPGGTSWAMPVTVAAYPGETVILQPPAGTSRVLMFSTSSSQYIIVSGLVLDGVNITYDTVKITWSSSGGTANHIRLLNCDIKNGAENNVLISGNSTHLADHNEILGCTIHDNRGISTLDGTHYHGIYCSSSYNLFQGNNVYNNTGYGIHIYQSSGVNPIECSYNTVDKNQCHDNGRFGGTGSAGIGVFVGDGNLVYDNLVWNNPCGIKVDYGASNTLLYNNTVYNSSVFGIDIADNATATGTIVRNNISYQNATDYSDRGTSTTCDHNLFGNVNVSGNLYNVNPLFVNPAAGDFHLQAGSPAIDAGLTISLVTDNLDGILRPQDGTYDIGCY
jgi:FKBP-type peptidyl-prolyl cis-trans isomerase 2